jgi:hypothetical protein
VQNALAAVWPLELAEGERRLLFRAGAVLAGDGVGLLVDLLGKFGVAFIGANVGGAGAEVSLRDSLRYTGRR